MEFKNLLHLDRLALADLGKFSVLLSNLLTAEQRAYLNNEIPDMMAQMGAFETQIPLLLGRPVPQDTWDKAKAFVKANMKIQAIREIRSGTGCGLKEAKDYVDNEMCK